MTLNGWMGKILRVDLNTNSVNVEETMKYARDFIGGRGINVKLLYDGRRPGTDAFDPENLLALGAGPLVGTLSPASGRWSATSRSALTVLADSNCGGHWGVNFKMTGFDNIAIVGRAKSPVYIWIDDGNVEILDASHLWGKSTWETRRIVQEDLGDPEIEVASIGSAGENLVRFAAIMTGLKDAAGRTGTGAIMGSKNLKAIAVRGTKGINVARPGELEKITEELTDSLKETRIYDLMATFGTPYMLRAVKEQNWLTARNFQTLFSGGDAISGEEITSRYSKRMKGCFGCYVSCKHYFKVEDGPYAGTSGIGPDYETLSALGAHCDNSDLASILKMNNLVNQFGMDSDSTGRVIGFAMECYEKGLISKEDAGGLDLSWGNAESMIKLIEKIAKREGVGDVLAEGQLRAAGKIGKGAEKFVYTIKGLEIHGENRIRKAYALASSTSSRGVDHLRGHPVSLWYIIPEVAKKMFGTSAVTDPLSYENQIAVIWYEHMNTISDLLGICKFATFWISSEEGMIKPAEMTKMFSAVTGIDMSEKQMMGAAERVWNLERAFLLREGVTRKDDTIPDRWFEEPVPIGANKGQKIDREKFAEMLSGYYKLRGWDITNGVPTRQKLEELGLGYLADDLKALGKFALYK
jgi:aldehyde:ferredoxin oxidoreductase